MQIGDINNFSKIDGPGCIICLQAVGKPPPQKSHVIYLDNHSQVVHK